MPCVVPNCDPKGQCFALHFPDSYLLSQRWKKAIELGSGVSLPTDLSPLEAEICQQHFCEFDQYGEPVIFWNNEQDREIRLSSCCLCLNFTLPTQIISNWTDLSLGEYTVKQLLQKVLRIQWDDSESLDCIICQQCLIRLDMVATIYGQLFNDTKVWKKLQSLSKHERRVWHKISTQKNDSLAKEKPIPSDAILLQVEMNKEGAIEEETNSEDFVQYEGEKKGVHAEKLKAKTDVEPSRSSEVSSISGDKSKRYESSTQRERINLPKKSVSKEASKQKIDKQRSTKNKHTKREKPKIYLRELNNRKCYLCIIVFDSPDELLAHLVDHSDEDLVCGSCSENFSSLPSYNRHLAKHDPIERPLQCNHCSLRYKVSKALRRHEELVHHIDHGLLPKKYKKDEVFTCQYCGKIFKFLPKLHAHEAMHTGSRVHKCKHCDKNFSSHQNLERHCMQKHTSIKPFKCNVCANVFRKSTSYEEHRKSCNPKIIRDLIENGTACNTCRFCSAEFPQHSDLIDHVVKLHSNEKVHFFRCNICKKRFVERYNYAVHMQKHSNAMEKPHLKCMYCSKMCKSEMILKAHEMFHERGNKFSCKHCSKTFAHSGNLLRHERIHTGLKAHRCEVCDKRFHEAAQLRIHSWIHTGERPFECDTCGKRFADRSTLYRHRKNVCTTV